MPKLSWVYNTNTLSNHSLIHKTRLTTQALCGMMELQLKKDMETNLIKWVKEYKDNKDNKDNEDIHTQPNNTTEA
jgi:hypothetical protein